MYAYNVGVNNVLLDAVVESWDRQADIVNRLAAKVQPSDLASVSAPGEGNLAYHLCHIHLVRHFWLGKVSKERAADFQGLFENWEEDKPSLDLDLIRSELQKSGRAISEAMRELLPVGEPVGTYYTHPIHFMQHMIWHEGWHVGAIVTTLRQAGNEPTEEWMEENMWGIWRTE